MYYKFSGFTQKLTGTWASDAYSPQVLVAAGRLGQKWSPEPLRLAVVRPEPGGISACGWVWLAPHLPAPLRICLQRR